MPEDMASKLRGSAAEALWSEPVLLTFESPRSTYFWQLHGLIDHWRQQWVDQQQPVPNPLFEPLQIDGGETEATIGAPGEVDRYVFTAAAAGTLVVETSGPSDVVLYVAGPDNPQRLHSFDDDSGQDFNARVQAQFAPGTYFVYAVFYDRALTGSYKISVSS